MKKHVAIVCANGIGDGLIMMVAAHAFYQKGYEVSFFHHNLDQLKDWFFPLTFHPQPTASQIPLLCEKYDYVFLQNDNSEKAKVIMKHCPRNRLMILYPSYQAEKHLPLHVNDYVCNSPIPLAQHIAKAMQQFFSDPMITTNNGITIPSQLIHRKNKKQVVIHPTSTTHLRTWKRQQFMTLGNILRKRGYFPVIVVSEKEKDLWPEAMSFSNLRDLCAFIYESDYFIGNESGLSHIASNLYVPNLVIAGCAKRIKLWRPGWLIGSVVSPPSWIPNIKGLRLREKYWQQWISPKQVFRKFQALLEGEPK